MEKAVWELILIITTVYILQTILMVAGEQVLDEAYYYIFWEHRIKAQAKAGGLQHTQKMSKGQTA